MAFVPIVGQVLAVAGVILDIILLIFAGAQEPEKTPAQIFIEGEGRDFLKTVEIDPNAIKDEGDGDDDGDGDGDDDDDGDGGDSTRSKIKRIRNRILMKKRELAEKKKRLENQ